MRTRSTLCALSAVALLAACAPTPSPEKSPGSPPAAATSGPTTATKSPEPVPERTDDGVLTPSPTETLAEPSASASGDPRPTQSPSEATSSSPVASTVGPSEWRSIGVKVVKPADAAGLTGTSADFRAWVEQRVSEEDADGCLTQVTVQAWHPQGFAFGDEFSPGCGGSQAIWGKRGGQWDVLLAMQDVRQCGDLEAAQIPRGVPGLVCEEAGKMVDY